MWNIDWLGDHENHAPKRIDRVSCNFVCDLLPTNRAPYLREEISSDRPQWSGDPGEPGHPLRTVEDRQRQPPIGWVSGSGSIELRTPDCGLGLSWGGRDNLTMGQGSTLPLRPLRFIGCVRLFGTWGEYETRHIPEPSRRCGCGVCIFYGAIRSLWAQVRVGILHGKRAHVGIHHELPTGPILRGSRQRFFFTAGRGSAPG